jgi:hypothetical protein
MGGFPSRRAAGGSQLEPPRPAGALGRLAAWRPWRIRLQEHRPSRKVRFSSHALDFCWNFAPRPISRRTVRCSVLRMICRSRVFVASGCGRRGSRGLICPAAALAACRRAAPRAKRGGSASGDAAPRNVVAARCWAPQFSPVCPFPTLAACRRAAPRAKRRRSAPGSTITKEDRADCPP